MLCAGRLGFVPGFAFLIAVHGTGVQHQRDEELPSGTPQPDHRVPLEFAVLQGDAHETGCEVRLHDAMRETQSLAVRLHQVEPVSPGDGQPDIGTAGKLLLREILDLAVDFRVSRRRLAQFQLVG